MKKWLITFTIFLAQSPFLIQGNETEVRDSAQREGWTRELEDILTCGGDKPFATGPCGGRNYLETAVNVCYGMTPRFQTLNCLYSCVLGITKVPRIGRWALDPNLLELDGKRYFGDSSPTALFYKNNALFCEDLDNSNFLMDYLRCALMGDFLGCLRKEQCRVNYDDPGCRKTNSSGLN